MVEVGKIDKILYSADYFFCEKANCRLAVDACLKRQKANRHRTRMKPVPFPECVECDQGKKNEALKDGLPATAKPRRGNGNRKMDCEFYEICLDIAAKRNWKTFKCDGCGQYGKYQNGKNGESQKMTTQRLCRICGENPPLHKNNEMCPSCMSKKSWEKRRSKNKGPDTPKKKTDAKCITHTKDTQEKPVRGQNTAITIEFGEHAAILQDIEKLSIQELRPVDIQIIYMLRNYLADTKEG